MRTRGLKGEQDKDASCGLQKERGDKMKVMGLEISFVVGGPGLPSDASEGTGRTLGRSTGYKRLPSHNKRDGFGREGATFGDETISVASYCFQKISSVNIEQQECCV